MSEESKRKRIEKKREKKAVSGGFIWVHSAALLIDLFAYI